MLIHTTRMNDVQVAPVEQPNIISYLVSIQDALKQLLSSSTPQPTVPTTITNELPVTSVTNADDNDNDGDDDNPDADADKSTADNIIAILESLTDEEKVAAIEAVTTAFPELFEITDNVTKNKKNLRRLNNTKPLVDLGYTPPKY